MKTERVVYSLAAVAAVLVAFNLYQIFMVLPDEAAQGAIYRIMFFHIPAAITAFIGFFVALVQSALFLKTSDLKYDALAASVNEVSLVFACVNLVTGSIWARIIWGIWWTWDARLTTTLVLWLIYVSYLLLRRFAAGPQVQTLAAVLGIFGALDVPIVYMSNRWWRTQHPAPVFGGGDGSGMDKSMLGPFFWNMGAWFAWGVLILALRYNTERLHQENASREQQEALESHV
jgi:heme exporter protein C